MFALTWWMDRRNISQVFFKDVYKLNGWVVMFGGSTMSGQVIKKESFLVLLNQLKDRGRLKSIDKSVVDKRETEIRERTMARIGAMPTECDDLHILALCAVTKCSNVITKDHRLSLCADLLRKEIGHNYCPSIRVISDEKTYLSLKKSNSL
ncbi:hypothetical protein [Dinoroseobacter sp. S375]|uniref:hypothetical protein n=1 Tax=Dinoroseobacter sp. S375 TaxID=3415136 RepID=UPI003C7A8398